MNQKSDEEYASDLLSFAIATARRKQLEKLAAFMVVYRSLAAWSARRGEPEPRIPPQPIETLLANFWWNPDKRTRAALKHQRAGIEVYDERVRTGREARARKRDELHRSIGEGCTRAYSTDDGDE